MLQANPNLVRPLRLIAAATLIGPALLFAYAAWTNHRALDQRATERIESALDVIQEHALKVFQTIDRAIAETNEVLRGLPDEQIRADEARLQARIKEIQAALPHIESIWAFDRNGRPLLASTLLPVPQTLNNSDRDYFRAQAAQDAGAFIGEVLSARVGKSQFFVFSRRRPLSDGRFNGIVAVTIPPDSLRDFYARVVQWPDFSAALIRTDGVFLARFPNRDNAILRLKAGSVFETAIAA